MGFLVSSDYSSQIRAEVKTIITGNSATIQLDAELKAQALMESYLRHRYKVAEVFIDIPAHNMLVAYVVNDEVYYTDGGVVYTYLAIQAGTGHLPTDTAYWKKGDKRDKHLVKLYVDIVLYNLHCSNNARTIPEHIDDAYSEALKWLEWVAQGKISAGLPLLTDDTGNPFKHGGIPQTGHHW